MHVLLLYEDLQHRPLEILLSLTFNLDFVEIFSILKPKKMRFFKLILVIIFNAKANFDTIQDKMSNQFSLYRLLK